MSDLKLWYETAASEWTEALPLGNGHMGAMVYGGHDGRFDLSEVTCWSGAPQEQYLHDDAPVFMREARAALLAGDMTRAESLLNGCNGIKENYGTQVPMGRLWIGVHQEPAHLHRSLDLRTGVCREDLIYQNVTLLRESFISNPDKVMAVKLSANRASMPDVRIWLEGWSQPSVTSHQANQLVVRGRALELMHSDGLHGVSYHCRLQIATDGHIEWSRQGLIIRNATEVTTYLTACTDMFTSDMEAICTQRMESALGKGWQLLLEHHVAEHAQWMDRCALKLPTGIHSDLPTNIRLARYREDKSDHALTALFFQYGRYLLLNSSRPDSLLPAALQGAWNDDRACRMGWTDDMHLDINTQMNYFPAETTGLGECTKPLFRWIAESLAPEGARIAKELYQCKGWVAHTVSNAFGWAAPGWEGYGWAFNITGGAWVATHLWNHFLYSRDESFLRTAWPVMRDAAEFLYNILLPHPITGELLMTPSYSPENAYEHQGEKHAITAGATVDTLITKYLFGAVIEASRRLGIRDELTDQLATAIEKLPPFKIGKHGQLMEWYEDYDEPYPDHRHTSHLLSLYPFDMITPEDTPTLAEAVKVSIQRRLGENAQDIVFANWAGALLILYHARLLDGEAAGQFLVPMMAFLSRDNLMITHEGPTSSVTGGIYELDGNTGFTAGVAEMLLHSHRGELHILPAIPLSWSAGRYHGLIGQGGHHVAVEWENHKLITVTVQAGSDEDVRLRYQNVTLTCPYTKGQIRRFTVADEQLQEI